MNNNMIELVRLIQSSGADGALVIDSEGVLKDAIDISYDGNIAAMTDAVFKMANDLMYDLGHSELVQMSLKSKNGIYVVHKYNDQNIICIHSKDPSKVGFIMMALKVLKL